MGIYDRDYMRESDPADWWKPGYSFKRWLTIAVIVVSLLTSIVWLVRTSGLARIARGPTYEKQSLKVNINSATQRELETLPGIGGALAPSMIFIGRSSRSICKQCERLVQIEQRIQSQLVERNDSRKHLTASSAASRNRHGRK
jgi:hypothetical protein